MSSKAYRSFTVSFKLKVIKHSESSTISGTARKYNIDRKQVRSWLGMKESLMSENHKHLRRRVAKRTRPQWPDMEDRLLDWINELRDGGNCVSGKMIKARAIEISSSVDFRASDGWLRRFLQRNRLTRRRITTSGRDLPRDAPNICRKFLNDCQRFRVPNFSRHLLINMDETSLYLDSAGKYDISIYLN